MFLPLDPSVFFVKFFIGNGFAAGPLAHKELPGLVMSRITGLYNPLYLY
jgi:hypothetical protein